MNMQYNCTDVSDGSDAQARVVEVVIVNSLDDEGLYSLVYRRDVTAVSRPFGHYPAFGGMLCYGAISNNTKLNVTLLSLNHGVILVSPLPHLKWFLNQWENTW